MPWMFDHSVKLSKFKKIVSSFKLRFMLPISLRRSSGILNALKAELLHQWASESIPGQITVKLPTQSERMNV